MPPFLFKKIGIVFDDGSVPQFIYTIFALFAVAHGSLQVTAHNDTSMSTPSIFEITCHFIWHHFEQGSLHLHSPSSEDQLVDVFTKSYPLELLCDLIFKLKIASSMQSWVWKEILVLIYHMYLSYIFNWDLL